MGLYKMDGLDPQGHPYRMTSEDPYRMTSKDHDAGGELIGSGILFRKEKELSVITHICKTPGFWSSLFNGISHGDQWKCRECNSIYEYDESFTSHEYKWRKQ
jgi:hypothetical protein